jgi:hypothetical protein
MNVHSARAPLSSLRRCRLPNECRQVAATLYVDAQTVVSEEWAWQLVEKLLICQYSCEPVRARGL